MEKSQYNHKCKIRRDTVSQLPKNYPDSSWQVRLKRKVQKKFLISPNHPEVFLYLKSSAAVEKESKRQVEKYPGFIIHPLSEFRKYWNIFVFLLMFTHQILSSFTIGFIGDMRPTNISAVVILDFVICSFLLIEIILTLRTGYIVQETNEIVLNPEVIGKKYFKEFISDFINCIPFVYVTTLIVTQKNQTTASIEAIVFMICLYLFSFYRLNRILSYCSSVPYMLNLTEKGTIVLMLCLRSIY